jgi:ADP-ribose pyrophosphatase
MSSNKHQIWKRLSQRTAYKGRVHIVEHTAQLPNGQNTKYEVEHSDVSAVAVLIKTADSKIVLTHQFRFPLDKWIYDLPGGATEPGEDTEAAAVRECQEEVGLAPMNLKKLALFYPNPARADWCVHVYYCDTFKPSSLSTTDPAENVEVVHMPIKDLRKLVDTHEIIDPTLLIAWFTACEKGYITS